MMIYSDGARAFFPVSQAPVHGTPGTAFPTGAVLTVPGVLPGLRTVDIIPAGAVEIHPWVVENSTSPLYHW